METDILKAFLANSVDNYITLKLCTFTSVKLLKMLSHPRKFLSKLLSFCISLQYKYVKVKYCLLVSYSVFRI